YKQALLRGAINRGAAGWQLVPDESATAFWQRYWELAKRLAPDLRMPRPADKPARSGFIRFRPAGLPAGVELLHKVRYGNVDLQFARMGDRVSELENRYAGRLDSDMRVDQAAKSAVVRITVPLVDIGAPFRESEEAVRTGLQAAMKLLGWYRANR
ncbi:MAG: hypothetical protein ACREA0_10895, partial [bacterium]